MKFKFVCEKHECELINEDPITMYENDEKEYEFDFSSSYCECCEEEDVPLNVRISIIY